MKKFVLLMAAGLMLGGGVFAKEENGALGFGIMSDSSETGLVGGGMRATMFLDVGYQLAGPVFYGFEFQGAVKKLNEDSSAFSQTDVTIYYFGNGYTAWYNTYNYTETYTLWDADFSPRGYLSFDLGSSIQILGFAGLNYNWQTLDYEIKDDNGSATITNPDGGAPLTQYKKSTDLGGAWGAVAGFRVSVGAFYADYTRFLNLTSQADVSWNDFKKDRLGLGINLRF